MESILFLAHRIPYPPNKGDKIRSFNFLKQLSGHYKVYLAAFVDDRDDWRYMEELRQFCADVCLVKLSPALSKLRSLTGLVTGEALTIPYYRNSKLMRWVDNIQGETQINHVFVFSSAMAQYAPCREMVNGARIIDFVDVDSEKWQQYSVSHKWPMSWVYRREARKLLGYDRLVASQFDRSIFVSQAEAGFFCKLAPETSARVGFVENGVDASFFDPHADYKNPYADGERPLVFTGAMDYWANVDAVTWFAREVFPRVLSRIPQARFYIVGSHPADEVRLLAKLDGVIVTGAVREIRSYLSHAVASVAPLRIARGIQNKVLEAMSMAKPVIATTRAMDGIRADKDFNRLVSDNATELARITIDLLEHGNGIELGERGRKMVQKEYSWDNNLQKLLGLIDEAGGVPQRCI